MLKKIILSSKDIPQGTKLKIEGNNHLFNMGDSIVSIIGNSTVSVYFYSSDGNTEIGAGTLNVSTTNASLNVEITN